MSSEEDKNESLLAKYIRIISVVAAYWVVSISMVFINKQLLSGADVQLDAPLFITFFQCCTSIAICLFLSIGTQIFPRIINFPKMQLDKTILIQVLPLSVIFVCMITFNNLCLKYVGVAFYYVGRSLTTVFNVVLTYFILKKSTSLSAILCCFLILVGFFLGVDQESLAGGLSLMGVLCGVLASLSVSLNSIYTGKVLPVVKGDIWLLTFNNNVNAVLLFLPLMALFGEFSIVLEYKNLWKPGFWCLMVIGGIFGFAIGFLTTLQIKVTSPLTHNISGTAKACAQTVLAVSWNHELKSLLWWTSNALVLCGSAAYTRVRQLEMNQQHEQQKQQGITSEKPPLLLKASV